MATAIQGGIMKNRVNIKVINNFIKENKLSKGSFAKQCKISVSTLSKILQGNDNVGLLAVYKIARVIKIELHEMFLG